MRKFHSSLILLILLALIPFLIPTKLNAQSFDLSTIADKNTAIPGGTGNFTMLFPPVPLGGDDVAFLAEGASDQEGLYTFISSTLAVVVDTSTAIPGGTGNFTAFGFPVHLGDADFAFIGFGSSGQEGIYTVIGGSLALVADLTTSIPGGTGTFTDFSSPVRLSGKDFLFNAEGASGQEGLYTVISNTLASAVDTSTNIPGGTGTFTSFSNSPESLGGSDFVFRGFGTGQEGIYTIISNTLAAVADFGTSIPGGTGNFTDFPSQPIALGGKNVAFRATGTGQEGVYTHISNTLTAVADFSTSIPGGTGNFTDFTDLISFGGNDVMFVGSGASDQEGIYTFISNTLAVQADRSDMIPGGTGNFRDFDNPVPIGEGDIAFQGLTVGLTRANYAILDGTIVLIANQASMIPDGSGTFTGIGFPEPTSPGNVAFRAFGSSSQEGLYISSNRQTSLTIIKDRQLSMATDFEFIGTGFPSNCEMDGTFTLNDEESVACDLDPATYTVQETNSQGLDITRIDCDGAADFSTTADSVTINLLEGENAVCTFTNTRPDPGDLFSVTLDGTGIGNVSGPGIDCGNGGMDCMEGYPTGTEITLVATPAPGSIFVGYTGSNPDCEDGVITITSNTGCTATFDLIVASSLTIVKESDPTGATGFEFTGLSFPANCPMQGDFMLDDGGSFSCDLSADSYTVIETNSQGFNISDIDCVGASDFSTTRDRVTVNIVDGEDVVCTFVNTNVPVTPKLDISLAGTGTGNVTAPGIDCGNGGMDCMETYMLGDEITLMATPTPGSNFVGFSGDPDCADGMVTMDEDVSCTATFDLNTTTYDLNVNIAGTGDGNVTATGIDCGDGGVDCMESYPEGTEVTLVATPKGGSNFVGFSGDSDCLDGMITINSNVTCTATFDLNSTTFDLNINLAGSGTGNVSATGIDCGDGGVDCMESYPEGTEVTLTATPNTNSVFAGYSGDADCEDGMVTVDGNKSCTATFQPSTSIDKINGKPVGRGTLIKNRRNKIKITGVTPNEKATLFWGFKLGNGTLNNNECGPIDMGIRPFSKLATFRANGNGIINKTFYLPSTPENFTYLQVVDLSTCLAGEVIRVILVRD